MVPFWEECQALAVESNIDVVCESVILYSLAKLCPSKKESCDVVPKVIELTQKNFTDPDISLSAISDILGYNEKYLSTLFKKKKGVTYTQYLRDQRIKHAIFLIEQGVESVKNVALLSGFRDALYFSKIFTASVGMHPKDYIKSMQKQE
jgi:YesN/AraC family two-component response regulator